MVFEACKVPLITGTLVLGVDDLPQLGGQLRGQIHLHSFPGNGMTLLTFIFINFRCE